MFTGDMTESRARTVTIGNIDGTALSLLVDFIYTAGQASFLTFKTFHSKIFSTQMEWSVSKFADSDMFRRFRHCLRWQVFCGACLNSPGFT